MTVAGHQRVAGRRVDGGSRLCFRPACVLELREIMQPDGETVGGMSLASDLPPARAGIERPPAHHPARAVEEKARQSRYQRRRPGVGGAFRHGDDAAHVGGEVLAVPAGIEQLAVLVKAPVRLQPFAIREKVHLMADMNEGVGDARRIIGEDAVIEDDRRHPHQVLPGEAMHGLMAFKRGHGSRDIVPLAGAFKVQQRLPQQQWCADLVPPPVGIMQLERIPAVQPAQDRPVDVFLMVQR